MIRVKVEGHTNFYGLSDVMRLFYGRIVEDRDQSLLYCEGGDVDIISRVDDGIVRTYIAGREDECRELIIRRAGEAQLEIKREVKRQLYIILSDLENKVFPWGCLTGIRPTIVAREEGSRENLISKYLLRPDKADLCIKTGQTEERILALQPEEGLNIYLGVPFCPSRCAYCSFVTQDITKHLKKLPLYADALVKEISIIGPKLDNVSTFYMGGGTPTVFDDRDFEKILNAVTDYIPMNEDTEITVEAGRADTIDEYKLRVMKEHGVKRICINPQTMSEETLRRFNRAHTVKDVIDIYKTAEKIGFEIINTDLIAGLNYDEPEELLDSLQKLFELDPENITIHTLYKKRAANLTRDNVLGGTAVADGLRDQRLDETVKKAYELLENRGYLPYYMYRQKDTSHGLENVGFAKAGTECLYNVAMMSDRRNVMAFGAGAVSKRIFEHGRLERCSSPKDVINYIGDCEAIARKKLEFFGLI